VDQDEFEKVQEIVADGIKAAGLSEVVLPEEESAAKRLADTVSDEAVNRMIADARERVFRCWTARTGLSAS
jgi:hypothetical protein